MSSPRSALTTVFTVLVASALLPMNANASNPFLLESNTGRISSLRFQNDSAPTEYLMEGMVLGELNVAFRREGEDWVRSSTASLPASKVGVGFEGVVAERLQVSSTFAPIGDRLEWRIRLTNVDAKALEVGDLNLPLPMNSRFDQAKGLDQCVMKHSFVSGAASFLFWMRPSSIGPYLLMTCQPGTSLEYWNHHDGPYRVYIHSEAEKETIREKKGSWRLSQTSKILPPGASIEYAFDFHWAKDYEGVRNLLAGLGKLDVQIAPGMTVPNDLFVEVALRSVNRIAAIEPEHPDKTEVHERAERGGYRIFRVRFKKLGENLLTVKQADGSKTYLEFFSCEPVETLIKKRGAFLAKSQHHDPSKWYRGLISDWNMETQVLLGPDNYDRISGWRIYAVTCDDPGLGKPAFLAAKNAEFPVESEVKAIDDTIEHFYWGGLQQTTEEPYPYSIYGIPDWKTLRESPDPGTKGKTHLWRCYDYPHVILLYHSMYRVASQYKGIKTRLSAQEYLKRAYGTAVAMFTVPDKLADWSPYFTGYYNELVIPNVVDDLEKAGMKDEANTLRSFWDKKTTTFVKEVVDLFGSEYPFDSTGFESTHALAVYAMDNRQRLGLTKDEVDRFLVRQISANLFCRGVLEPAYYLLGSDYRASGSNAYTLSYMAQMGGWSVMDYALHHSGEPMYLRLGYQSLLSSWALMNSGTESSNYGYWYPGKGNDGGAGGGFEPASYGTTWLEQPHGRGSWYYGCEIDLGFSGALRGARTVVADDSIFGRFTWGGIGTGSQERYRFTTQDGLRRRLSIRTKETQIDLELEGVHFVSAGEHVLDEQKGQVEVVIEPTVGASPSIMVRAGKLNGWRLKITDEALNELAPGEAKTVRLPDSVEKRRLVLVRKS